MDPKNHVLDRGPIPQAKGEPLGKRGRPIVKYRIFYHELCKNDRTDQDAIWEEDSGCPNNHVLDEGLDPPWEGALLMG